MTRKFSLLSALFTAMATTLLFAALITCAVKIDAKTVEETTSDFIYVEAVKFGEIEDYETAFMTNDGNVYTFGARFAEKNGSRFLIVFDTHNTEDPTDDEIVELWANPHVEYDVIWSN